MSGTKWHPYDVPNRGPDNIFFYEHPQADRSVFIDTGGTHSRQYLVDTQ